MSNWRAVRQGTRSEEKNGRGCIGLLKQGKCRISIRKGQLPQNRSDKSYLLVLIIYGPHDFMEHAKERRE